jgi:hypothetical protein
MTRVKAKAATTVTVTNSNIDLTALEVDVFQRDRKLINGVSYATSQVVQ